MSESKKNNKVRKMTRKEIEEAISWILKNDNCKSFNQRMKLVMKELEGKADEGFVRKIMGTYSYRLNQMNKH